VKPPWQMIPVTPKVGGVVHATSLFDPSEPRRTACGVVCDGWVVAPGVAVGTRRVAARINCDRCKARMFRPVSAEQVAEYRARAPGGKRR
jgi:hypothetical protein